MKITQRRTNLAKTLTTTAIRQLELARTLLDPTVVESQVVMTLAIDDALEVISQIKNFKSKILSVKGQRG